MIDTTTKEFKELIMSCSHPLVQKKWSPTVGDWIYDEDYKFVGIITDYNEGFAAEIRWTGGGTSDFYVNDRMVWIPLPIDTINPERGVWKWIDWEKYMMEDTGEHSTLSIMEVHYGSLRTLLDIFLRQQRKG